MAAPFDGCFYCFGIPMAWAATRGHAGALAWALIAGNLCWVLAYDTEYAMVDRDDDLKIGIKTSAIAFGRWDVAAVATSYALYVGIWWGLLWLAAPPSPWVRTAWAAGLLAVLAQVAWHLWLIRTRERAACFTAFKHNHWIGLTTLATCVALTLH